MQQLAGRKAVVTGSSEGIGFGIASAFAQNGADLWLVARDKAKLEAACEKLAPYNTKVYFTCADLTDIQSAETLAAEISTTWEQIDVLVNNAGVARFTPFLKVTATELDLQLNLNVRVPYVLTQKLLPRLIPAQGCIINVSSYFAVRMMPGRPSTAYSLSKGAINAFTKALACELGSLGVRVNAIAPGTVRTPLFEDNITNRLSSEEKNKFDQLVKQIYPLGRIGEPEDLGGIAVYLASDAAKWVTGAIFNIDGGLTTN
jgi:NAD(P)-dependent dehydrogenase (short-subunit alcohol dehydrogenase family)